MKRWFYTFLGFFFFALPGCETDGGPSKDPEENLYYSKYRNVFRSYGKVSMDSTRALLNAYLEEYPQNEEAWSFLGGVSYYLEDYKTAKSAYHHAVGINRKKAAYYSALGSTCSMLEQTDSAELYFLRALSLQDSTYENYFNLSLLYSKTNNLPRSLLYADSALEKKKIPAPVLAGLSLVYEKAGKKFIAEEMFAQAKQTGLKDTTAFRQVLDGKMKLENYYRNNQTK